MLNHSRLSLRHAVCIFYLVLRALDTVEDDMSIPLEKKVPLLQDFHTFLYQPEWSFAESREKDRQVLEDFPTVTVEISFFFDVNQLELVEPHVSSFCCLLLL
uniref:Uncharacterized protein n=1 Tax=Sinocyclocheilus rhinocerous TaxID=307959 RepID=A0A673MS41_9TELE